ncbi:hypothetical protein D3C84_851260 [compost metagenome]
MGRQAGSLKPFGPLIRAIGTQQRLLQQIVRRVQLPGNLGHAQHRQRRFDQPDRFNPVPRPRAKPNRVIQPFCRHVHSIVVGRQAQIYERMFRLKVRQSGQ